MLCQNEKTSSFACRLLVFPKGLVSFCFSVECICFLNPRKQGKKGGIKKSSPGHGCKVRVPGVFYDIFMQYSCTMEARSNFQFSLKLFFESQMSKKDLFICSRNIPIFVDGKDLCLVSNIINKEAYRKPEIYIQSALNNSNETYTFMCLCRAGHFGQC